MFAFDGAVVGTKGGQFVDTFFVGFAEGGPFGFVVDVGDISVDDWFSAERDFAGDFEYGWAVDLFTTAASDTQGHSTGQKQAEVQARFHMSWDPGKVQGGTGREKRIDVSSLGHRKYSAGELSSLANRLCLTNEDLMSKSPFLPDS